MDKKKLKGSVKSHLGFLTVMSLFGAVSMFSMISFFNTNNDYLAYTKASLFNVAEGTLTGDEIINLAPSSHLCDPFCLALYDDGDFHDIFSDVNSTNKNAVAIETFYDLGVVQGYGDGSFGPDKSLNRAELLKILTSLVDADFSGQYLSNCFDDVADQWFAPFVCYAFEAKWVDGYGDGTFRPANNVTRAEALKMTLNTFGYTLETEFPEPELLDVNLGDWFVGYVFAASENGIIATDGRFGPMEDISRAEFMQLVYNAMYYKGLL